MENILKMHLETIVHKGAILQVWKTVLPPSYFYMEHSHNLKYRLYIDKGQFSSQYVTDVPYKTCY